MDWERRLSWLSDNGYRGLVGLEYQPTGRTEDTLTAVLRER